jgi:hypothetical protein
MSNPLHYHGPSICGKPIMPLLSYYHPSTNIYHDCHFMALPAVVSTAVPHLMLVHRVTHCGEPYPLPYHEVPFPCGKPDCQCK